MQRHQNVVILSTAKDLLFVGATVVCFGMAIGCKPAPSAPSMAHHMELPIYPPRPAVPAPPFHVFHQTTDSLTLVTTDDATDEQIEAILWQLRDAARAHSLDRLGIPQKMVDNRSPIVFFHLYRGSKCASEKYTTGALPCGASYHAAGEFTFGSYANRDRTDSALLHDEEHQTELWNPDTASSP